MKTFQDLFIKLNGYDLKEFEGRLKEKCTSNWKPRALDKKAYGNNWLCYEHSEGDKLPHAALFLADKSPDLFYVSNIVPKNVSELSYDQYNVLLNDFISKVVRPAIERTQVEVEITEPETSIAIIAGEDISKKLDRFSVLANKSTGSAHPLDLERWFDFIVAVHKEGVVIDTDMLIRTLIEQGWSEDKAGELAEEYEFALALLKYFEEI